MNPGWAKPFHTAAAELSFYAVQSVSGEFGLRVVVIVLVLKILRVSLNLGAGVFPGLPAAGHGEDVAVAHLSWSTFLDD